MAEKDGLDFFKIDYRLRGFPVKDVIYTFDRNVDYFNDVFSSNIVISKGVFYNFLKLFRREKEFRYLLKNHKGCEKELYNSYVITFSAELKENSHKTARIFETEEEDRTNKRHRRCTLNMLPFLRDFGSFYIFFGVRLYDVLSKNENFTKDLTNYGVRKNFSAVKTPKRCIKGDKEGGWRRQKR